VPVSASLPAPAIIPVKPTIRNRQPACRVMALWMVRRCPPSLLSVAAQEGRKCDRGWGRVEKGVKGEEARGRGGKTSGREKRRNAASYTAEIFPSLAHFSPH
jgi:hypothetical protein